MQISNARDSFLERMFDQQLEKTGGEKPEKLKPYFFFFFTSKKRSAWTTAEKNQVWLTTTAIFDYSLWCDKISPTSHDRFTTNHLIGKSRNQVVTLKV